MLPATIFDVQYQQYHKTIHKIFLEGIPLFLPKFEELERCKRGIIGNLFTAIVGIA